MYGHILSIKLNRLQVKITTDHSVVVFFFRIFNSSFCELTDRLKNAIVLSSGFAFHHKRMLGVQGLSHYF